MAADAAVLDAALIGATEDKEISLHTPVGVPTVGDLPVLDVVEGTPADDTDSVATEEVVAGLLVHTGLVGGEVIINIEGNLEGAVGHELALVGLLTANAVARCTLDRGHGRRGAVASALRSAGGSGVLAGATWGILTSHVVVALREGVRLAVLSEKTSADPVVPGSRRITAVAAASAHPAAGKEAAGGKKLVTAVGASGAQAISHSASASDGPAGTAVRLVINVRNGGAVRPVGDGIKGIGDGGGTLLFSEDAHGVASRALDVLSTEQALNLSGVSAFDDTVLLGGNPSCSLHGVDAGHGLGSHDGLGVSVDAEGGADEQGSDDDSAHRMRGGLINFKKKQSELTANNCNNPELSQKYIKH